VHRVLGGEATQLHAQRRARPALSVQEGKSARQDEKNVFCKESTGKPGYTCSPSRAAETVLLHRQHHRAGGVRADRARVEVANTRQGLHVQLRTGSFQESTLGRGEGDANDVNAVHGCTKCCLGLYALRTRRACLRVRHGGDRYNDSSKAPLGLQGAKVQSPPNFSAGVSTRPPGRYNRGDNIVVRDDNCTSTAPRPPASRRQWPLPATGSHRLRRSTQQLRVHMACCSIGTDGQLHPMGARLS